MFRRHYAFGGVVIRIESPVEFSQAENYELFEVPEAAPDYTVNVALSDHFPEIPAESAVKKWNTSLWREGETAFAVNTEAGPAGEPKYPYVYAAARQRDARVVFKPEYREKLSARLIFDALDFFRVLAAFGGAVLHASFVVTAENEAILFSGPSGVGKSTQAELWRRERGAGIMNGDRALARKTPGGWAAFGVFYSGASNICKNHRAPIRAVVLLGQAAENRIARVSPKEAFRALLPQCSYYPWDAENMSAATQILAELVSEVPVYGLDCLPEPSAVALLEKTLKEARDAS